jgi:hypothetical protein
VDRLEKMGGSGSSQSQPCLQFLSLRVVCLRAVLHALKHDRGIPHSHIRLVSAPDLDVGRCGHRIGAWAIGPHSDLETGSHCATVDADGWSSILDTAMGAFYAAAIGVGISFAFLLGVGAIAVLLAGPEWGVLQLGRFVAEIVRFFCEWTDRPRGREQCDSNKKECS